MRRGIIALWRLPRRKYMSKQEHFKTMRRDPCKGRTEFSRRTYIQLHIHSTTRAHQYCANTFPTIKTSDQSAGQGPYALIRGICKSTQNAVNTLCSGIQMLVKEIESTLVGRSESARVGRGAVATCRLMSLTQDPVCSTT